MSLAVGEDSVAPVEPEDRAGDGEDDTEDGDDGGEDDQIFSTVLTQELSSITRKKFPTPDQLRCEEFALITSSILAGRVQVQPKQIYP